jgi:hypothetical protein
MVNDTLYKAMHKLKDSAGLPILPEGGDGRFSVFQCFQRMAAPAANAKSLAFGWSVATIRDAMEMDVFRLDCASGDSVYAKLG